MKQRNQKLKPTSVYFLGNPDEIHYLSTMMSNDDTLILVDNPDHADKILTTKEISPLLNLNSSNAVVIDLASALTDPQATFVKIKEKIKPNELDREND